MNRIAFDQRIGNLGKIYICRGRTKNLVVTDHQSRHRPVKTGIVRTYTITIAFSCIDSESFNRYKAGIIYMYNLPAVSGLFTVQQNVIASRTNGDPVIFCAASRNPEPPVGPVKYQYGVTRPGTVNCFLYVFVFPGRTFLIIDTQHPLLFTYFR